MSNKSILAVLVFFAAFCFNPSNVLPAALIADHNAAADFEDIPPSYIELAKSIYRIGYGHTSHGSQVITGIHMLMDDTDFGIDYTYGLYDSGCSSSLFMCDKLMPNDLGYSTWEPDTRTALNNSSYNRNMIMWSWCGQVSSSDSTDIEDYLSKMDKLREDYPNVTFVYMTGHLDGSESDGNLHERNEQIRQHVRDTDGILFDFADVERYDPDGIDYLNLGAGIDTNGCLYDGGNWCTTWCSENTCPDYFGTGDYSCAHSNGLNCFMKGKAFWWMMAKLAGWEYDPGDGDGNGDGTNISSGCGLLSRDSNLQDSLIILAFLFAAVFVLRRNRK